MTYQEAINELKKGHKVRLPEWQGYWFPVGDSNNPVIKILTKDGEILGSPWGGVAVTERTDWEIADGLTFGWALNAVKKGKLVARKGWNGKGMFIFMRPADELSVDFIVNRVKSLPQSVKDYFDKKYDSNYEKASGGEFTATFTPYLCMKAADDTIVNGWLASQTDMLAEDWELVA